MVLSKKSYSLSLLLILSSICHILQIPDGVYASKEYNRYLAHLFRKYGNGASITFEGLEHLMFKLGLGHLEFEPNHSIDEHHPQNESPDNNEDQLRRFIEEHNNRFLFNESDDIEITRVHGSTINNREVKQQTPLPEQHIDEVWWEFKELHDPQHKHLRTHDDEMKGHKAKEEYDDFKRKKNVCLSPKSLLRLVVDHDDLHKNKIYTTIIDTSVNHNYEDEYNNFINNVKLTPTAFLKICPALLAQIEEEACIRRVDTPHNDEKLHNEQELWNAWIYATSSIFILSISGLIGVLLVPLAKSVAYQKVLTFLIAVAVGTLSGDALMHLLPHALQHAENTAQSKVLADIKDHEHDSMTVYICACAFFTAVGMYVMENLLPLLRAKCLQQSHTHVHSHSHSHSHQLPQSHENAQSQVESAQQQSAPIDEASKAESTDINVMLNELQQDAKSGSKALTPLAFMVVLGDGLHNITDGLAVGAAFATDPVTGMATALAVLAHELPHELGDFALLLQTGVSMRRAVFLNIISSILSFMGMAMGLLLTSSHQYMTQWIYAATAGSFLYIAFADLLPAMSIAVGEQGRSIKVVLVQIIGFILGGLLMLVIALNEHDLEILFK